MSDSILHSPSIPLLQDSLRAILQEKLECMSKLNQLQVCMRVCVRACVRACLRACVRACLRACVRACVRMCVCLCVCACVCAYVCVHAGASPTLKLLIHVHVRHADRLKIDINFVYC